MYILGLSTFKCPSHLLQPFYFNYIQTYVPPPKAFHVRFILRRLAGTTPTFSTKHSRGTKLWSKCFVHCCQILLGTSFHCSCHCLAHVFCFPNVWIARIHFIVPIIVVRSTHAKHAHGRFAFVKEKKNKTVESIGRVNVGVATILQQSISGLTVHNSRLNQRGW